MLELAIVSFSTLLANIRFRFNCLELYNVNYLRALINLDTANTSCTLFFCVLVYTFILVFTVLLCISLCLCVCVFVSCFCGPHGPMDLVA